MQVFKAQLCNVAAVILFVLSSSAYADTWIQEIWSCKLRDGKTMEELRAINDRYLEWTNKQQPGAGIRGYVAAPAIAVDRETVLIVGIYPDLATYAADAERYWNTEAGAALEAEYDKISTCSSNTVYTLYGDF